MLSRILLSLALLGFTAGASAVLPNTPITKEDEEKAKRKVSELTWADKGELSRYEQVVENLGQRHFGRSLRNDLSDLELLQRIADRQLIKQNDTQKLQALGVVLGNSLQRELGLEWAVYSDDVGRSRALCVPATENCLFPMTMLSRRLEVGLPVDVNKVYQDAVASIEPFLPDSNAYDGSPADPTERPGWLKDRPKEKPPLRIRIN